MSSKSIKKSNFYETYLNRKRKIKSDLIEHAEKNNVFKDLKERRQKVKEKWGETEKVGG